MMQWLRKIDPLDVQELFAMGFLVAGLWSLYGWGVAAVVAGGIILVESMLARLRTRKATAGENTHDG